MQIPRWLDDIEQFQSRSVLISWTYEHHKPLSGFLEIPTKPERLLRKERAAFKSIYTYYQAHTKVVPNVH
jgi:hypothetical protein